MRWKLGSWQGRKENVSNPKPPSTPQGKNSYQLPKCTQISISEIAQFVRGRALGHEIQLGNAGTTAPNEAQCLLVYDYAGDLNFLRPTVGVPTRELQPFASKKGVGWLEMKFHGTERAEPQDNFLLLDLRNRHRAERGFLELIGHGQHLDESLPRVILAVSAEQFLGWKGVAPQHCWHLRSCQTPEDLSAALHSFLNLCSTIANWPGEEKSTLGSVSGDALIGKTSLD